MERIEGSGRDVSELVSLTFPGRPEGNREDSVRLAGVLAGIRTILPSINQECYR
jgi:hypothetical protein